MLRIIGGTHRSRKLLVPEHGDIRPTADRVREAIFSMLAHRLGTWEGVHVLDACCGSGALGLEALSRGAAQASFMDNNSEAIKLVRENASMLKESDRCHFMGQSVLNPAPAPMPCHVIFLDPPYGRDLAAPALLALTHKGWAAPACLAIVETGRGEVFTPPPHWHTEDTRTHGPATVHTLSYSVT